MDRGPYRHVDVLARIVHGHAREWHPMLPANQSAYAPGGCMHCFQSAAITVSPDEAFRVGRHEFPMVVSQPSVVRNSEERVVERSIPGTSIYALVHSNDDCDF